MELLEAQSRVLSVNERYERGVSSVSNTRHSTSPCFCHRGDYCVQECIKLDNDANDTEDNFLIDIRSGEDVFEV